MALLLQSLFLLGGLFIFLDRFEVEYFFSIVGRDCDDSSNEGT